MEWCHLGAVAAMLSRYGSLCDVNKRIIWMGWELDGFGVRWIGIGYPETQKKENKLRDAPSSIFKKLDA